MAVIFSGFGCCIPSKVVDGNQFLSNEFFDRDGNLIEKENEEIIEKFESITGIHERRYAADNQVNSDLALDAAKKAIKKANVDPETLDGIICAHNYGDKQVGELQAELVPSLASRVKNGLKIHNSNCITFDVLAGCPGWLQGVIIAYKFLREQPNGKFLIIGSEVLSRVSDPHDRDSMIYADGGGAVVLSHVAAEDDSVQKQGILSMASRSYTLSELSFLNAGASYKKTESVGHKFLKMQGRKVYEFALKEVPRAIKDCLDLAEVDLKDVKRVILHQANEKMDQAIVKRLFRLYGIKEIPEFILPMSIAKLGNSSVATIPTLMSLIMDGKMPDYAIERGDVIVLASVGAGMNVNAITYRF